MRQLLNTAAAALAVLALGAAPALAEPSWARGLVDPRDDIYVGSATEDFGVSYILTSSIAKTEDGYATVTSRFEYREAASFNNFTFLSLRQTYQVDCQGQRTRLTDRRAFAPNKLTRETREMSYPSEWSDAEPGTLIETLVEMTCETVGTPVPSRRAAH